eukprot:CAMPEP_0178902422 /NCGR_PEP_ID=MMETSP0786-20121207/4592_1 /TAXON_ID=186022 /ORGANISM="Thalassionema frauenfeldii, Strain CCMP 1798" /LENGTH=673 /DNA_ID=CAMNT_0020573679 /DNA_START=270 /DNA_END=2291 /DNA_ORIENTATION=+
MSSARTSDGYENSPVSSAMDLDISEMAKRILRSQSNKNNKKGEGSILALKDGLTKVHRNILSQTQSRQRFVTGQDPLLITVKENPTKKWLQKNAATVQLLVNGTNIDNSWASYDRFQWIDNSDLGNLVEQHSMFNFELVAEINIKKPGYLNILPSNSAGSSAEMRRMILASKEWDRWKKSSLYEQLVHEELGKQSASRMSSDRLWITGFTLSGQSGYISSLDVKSGRIETVKDQTCRAIRWPNESNSVPKSLFESQDTSSVNSTMDDALLVSDGFLVPGKDKGGLYVVKKPGDDDKEWNVCLTGGPSSVAPPEDSGWFYHRSVWIDLTNDGRKSVLTARAKLNGAGSSNAKTQLVWLETPKPDSYDELSGSPLEEDGTPFDPFNGRHLPWKAHVLTEGPDVMFSIADMDTADDTIEVFASHFFDRKVMLYSIRRGPKPEIVFERSIDEKCGAAFGCTLANLNIPNKEYHEPNGRMTIDSGSTIPTLRARDSFSHLLVTSHECRYTEGSENKEINGGSLFAYRVPSNAKNKNAWKFEPWLRTTVISDFTVKGQLSNIINPGAPGFVYTFYARREEALNPTQRPLIAIAGDCAESAYILRPIRKDDANDPEAQYKVMCEIACGSTVGSIGVGYDNFMHAEQEDDYAKLYIPCYEKDKILVFAMGSGLESIDHNGF